MHIGNYNCLQFIVISALTISCQTRGLHIELGFDIASPDNVYSGTSNGIEREVNRRAVGEINIRSNDGGGETGLRWFNIFSNNSNEKALLSSLFHIRMPDTKPVVSSFLNIWKPKQRETETRNLIYSEPETRIQFQEANVETTKIHKFGINNFLNGPLTQRLVSYIAGQVQFEREINNKISNLMATEQSSSTEKENYIMIIPKKQKPVSSTTEENATEMYS